MLAYFRPLALAALRVFTAFIIWQHATRTLFGMFGGEPADILSPLWFLGLTEFVGSLALGIGFLTRPMAIIVAMDMFLTYLVQYLPRGFPPQGGSLGEQLVELSIASAFLAFAGPGRFSVEADLARDHPDLHVPLSANGLDRYYPQALAVCRILMALLFTLHSLSKLGIGGGEASALFTQRWIAGVIELLGGLALALGVFTRPIAFIASGEMAFAYFLNHAPNDLSPIVNGGDRAALYCFFFLVLVTTGPGAWAIDTMLWGKRTLREG